MNTKHPDYNVWRKMRSRCNSPSNQDYQYYGARGIKVCSQWASFAVFNADMGNRPSQSHTIDRIDCDGDYEPENCRWATVEEQNRNKRTVRRITINGESVLLYDAARKYNIDPETLWKRHLRGAENDELITANLRRPAKQTGKCRWKYLNKKEFSQSRESNGFGLPVPKPVGG